MKKSRFLLSTLFAAAALSVAPAVPALADGEGTASSPYSGTIENLDLSGWEAGTTVYIDGWSSGYWVNSDMTVVANINIGSGGMSLTNAYSDKIYTFAGAITGSGNWTFTGVSSSTQTQHYIFTGDLSNYSGNFSMTASNSSGSEGYLQFGNGGQAATNTNVSGTGSITEATNGSGFAVIYNYGSLASDSGETAITVGNTSITTQDLRFTGSVNYIVSSALTGAGSNATLAISNSGTTTITGSISGFSSVTVADGSTLAISGSVDLTSPIENSGTVSLNESVIFVLDNMSFTGGWEEGATYTLITGGTIKIDSTTLTGGTIYSLDTSNLYTADGTISSATFSYDSGSLTVTVTGEHPDNGLNGDGSAKYPYFTYGSSAVSIPVSIFTGVGTTVYLATDEQSLGTASMQIYWSDAFTAACNIVIGAAGVYITDGSGGQSHTFSGAISGTGDFTVTHNGSQGQSVNQDYTFTGDLSEWSGNFTIDTTHSSDYVHYGEGTVAATGTNVTGTGAISVSTGTVQFNYITDDGTNKGPSTITIGNSSITANNIIFVGDVTYVVDLTKTTIAPNNLTVEKDATLKIAGDGEILIDSPSYVVDIEGTLEVGEGVAFTLHKRTHTATSVTNLVLDNGSTFTLYTQGDNPSAISDGMAVGTLTVNGSAKLEAYNWQNYVSIGTLIGEDATLALSSTAASDAATIYELGGSNTGSSFTGTITLSEDATGNYRGITLVISDEKVAAGAVIEMGTEYNTNDSIALGVNASRVEIAGLVSSNSGGDIVYSGYVSLGATFGDGGATLADYKNQSNYGSGSNYDGVGTTTNTLVITVASGESYSFSGVFLDKVNIEKGGEGTQSIAFNVNQWQSANYFDGSIVVTGGTLNLSGVAITSSGISVSTGATLSIANQITLASNSSSTVSGNLTVTGDGELVVSSGATLDLSGATVSLSSTIANSGTVTVNSSTIFLIDELTGGVSGTYTLISGAISGWDDSITSTNFSTDTRATITVVSSGIITYESGAANLVWNGSLGDVWELEGDDVWLNGGTADSFYNDDTVTFNSSAPSSTVIVSGTVKPGSITVNSNYTFTVASGDTALIDTSILTISNGATLTIDKGVTIYFDIGTVTALSISGIAGTGTLEFEFTSDYTSTVDLGDNSAFEGEVYIISGNLQLGTSNIGNGSYRVASGVNLQSDGAVSIPGLIIEGDTTLSKANSSSNNDTSVSITSLVIENNSTLTFYTTGDNPSSSTQGLLVGTLTVSGDSATMKTDYWQNYVSIGSIVGTGATLNLGSTASSSVATIYELTGTGTSSFTGTISLSDTNSSNSNRGVTLIISNASVASGAVIEMGSELSSDTLALGVNASTVEIAGLVSGGSGNNGADVVYSGYVSLGTELGEAGHDFTNSSGTHYGIIGNDGTGTYANVGKSTNTLVINVAEGASYSFTGVFLDKLNIEKKGKGTQAINFEDESYFDGKITVSAGTLSISGVVGASEINVADGANLELTGDITLSSAVTNSGTVTVSDSVVFILDNLTGVETEEGTVYTIISGGTIYGWDDLTDSNFVTDSRATVTVGTGADAGTVTILEGVAADLIWSGSVDNVWDRTTKNWTNNGTQDKFAEHDSVTFTSTGQGTVTVESEGVIANIVTVSSGTYSFTGGDITAESFVIESGATVSLSGSLIYSDFVVSGTLKLDTQIDGGYSGEIYGAITIDNGGKVELNVGDATGWEPGYGVTGITVNSGGTLYVGTDSNQTLGGCTLTLVGGTVTGVENSNIDIYTNSSVVVKATSDATAENPTVSTVTKTTLTPRFGNGSSTTFDIGDNAKLLVESGIVSGAQGSIYNDTLVKTGAGTLEVTGIFALNQGKLDVQEGSVVLEGTVIGTQSWGFSIGFASAVTISAGASLEMNLLEDTVLGYYEYGDTLYDSTFVGSCSITGAGDFIKSGSTSLTVSNYGVTGSTTISKGTLILSGNSTIGGTVTIAGTLEVASGASLTLEGTLGGSNSTGTVTFANGAKLIISDSFLGNSIEITVNDDGTTSVTSGGAITVIDASTIIFGSTTIDGNTELSSLLGSFVQYSEDYTLEWAYSDGVLTATITDANVKTYLLPTAAENNTTSATNNVMAAGYYVIDPRESNTSKQGWIDPWGSGKASDDDITLSFEEGSFFYGEGLLGIYFKLGSGSTVETTDLTNVDASNLKGQLIVINSWNNETDVKLLGDTWANVEYLFANAVDDETIAEKYGLTGITRGDLNNALGTKTLEDILALQGDTTLAGVTGASKGATTHGTDSVYITLCDHETITVASSGTTLTIAGSSEYAFYGKLATSSARVTLSMTGTGSQTFGGTNYLQHVYVSNGNLVLGGNTDVASTTTVSGSTLTVGCSYDDEGQSVSFGGSVTVEEGGTLAITGTGYFSGETSVVGGALQIASGSTTTFYGPVSVSSGGTFQTASGSTMAFGGSVSVSSDSTITLGGTTTFDGSLVVSSGGTLEIAGEITLSDVISNSGTVSIDASSATFVVDSLELVEFSEEVSYYKIISNSGSGTIDASGLSISNFTGDKISSRWVVYYDDRGLYIYLSASETLVWAGTEGNNSWTVSSTVTDWKLGSEAKSFTAEDDVKFDNTAAYKTVSISEGITAGYVTVSGEGYEFSISGSGSLTATDLLLESGSSLTISGGSVTVTSLEIENNANLALSGSGMLAVSTASISGTLSLGDGTTLDLTGATLSDIDTVGVYGTGTILIVATSSDSISLNDDFAGTLKVSEGTLNVSSLVGGSNTTLEFVAGTFDSSSVTSTTNIQFSSSTPLTNDIILSGDGAIVVGLESGTNIEISGKVTSGENVTLYRGANNGNGGDVLTFSGEVDLAGGYTSYRGKTKFSGGGSIGTLTLYDHGYTDGVTFSGDGMTYTIGTISFIGSSNSGTVSLDIDSGVTVNADTFSASWGIKTVTVNGTFNVGKISVATGGNSDTFTGSGTITVGELSVGNAGKYTFSSLDLYIGAGGITNTGAKNGYTLTFGDGLTVGVYAGDNENKSWSTSEAIILSGSVTFKTESEESITLSGVLSGSGTLIKEGEGTLTLSGSNTFTGGITLSEGTLEIGNANALGGTLTIGDGTTLTGSSVTLTGASFVVTGDATISGLTIESSTFDWAVGAKVSLDSSATITAGTVNFASETDFTGEAIIIFTNTGLDISADLSGWTATLAGYEGDVDFSGTFSVDSSGNIVFVASDEYLNNYGSLVWDADSSKDQTWAGNYFQGTEYGTGRNYLFNEKSYNATSKLSGTITTNRVTIDGEAGEITWTTATNSTTISGTDLNINAGATLNFTPSSGATGFALNFTNINLSGALVYAGAGVTWSTVTFGDDNASLTLSLSTTDAVTISNLVASTGGAISSTGGSLVISKASGSGDVTISGSSDGDSVFNVSLGDLDNYSGMLSLEGNTTASLTQSAYNNTNTTISVGEGATLDLNGHGDTMFKLVLAGGTLTSSSSTQNSWKQLGTLVSVTADSYVNTGDGVFFGLIGSGYGRNYLDLGESTLTVTGTGTFYLRNTEISGESGTLQIDGGTVDMNNSTSVKDGSSLSIGVGSDGKLALTTSLVLDTLNSAGSITLASGYSLEIAGEGEMTISGEFVLNSSTLSVTGGAVVDMSGVTTSQNGGSGTLIISGEGSTIKIASGAWGSSSSFGSNMNNCYLQISDGGILEVTAVQASAGAGYRGFAIMSGTGTYRYSGEGTSYVAENDASDSAAQKLHIADGATLVFDVVNEEATLDVSKLIANSYNGEDPTETTGSVKKTGAGTLILSGENLYSGGTTISAGILELQDSSALGSGNVKIEKDGTLVLNDEDETFTLPEVSGEGSLVISAGTLATSGSNLLLTGTTTIEESGTLALTLATGTTTLATTIAVENGGTLTLSSSSDAELSVAITVADGENFAASITGGTTTLSGAISGDGTLTKTGSGTLVLSENTTITNIAMSEGTLSGFTLSEGMTATITGGALDSFTVASGTLVSEIDSVLVTGYITLSGGSISLSNALSDSADAYFNVDVANNASVTITGAITFNLDDIPLTGGGDSATVVIFDSGVTFDNGISVNDLTLNYGGSGSGGDPHFSDDTGFVWDEDSGSLSARIGLKSIDLHWQGSSETGGNILKANEVGNFYQVDGKDASFFTGDTIYFGDASGSDAVVASEVTLGSDIEAGAIIVEGNTTITLDTDNGTYALVGEGTLSVASGSSLTLTNARHSYTGSTTVAGSLTLGITSDSGQLFASVVSGTGSLTLDIAEDLTISIADNLTGEENQLISGEITFIKSGSGTLVVDAAQTDFTGEVQITAGTMVIAETGLFGENATIAIGTDGTLEITDNIDSLTETLTGAGTLLIDENLTLTTDASKLAGFEGTTMLSDGVTLTLSNTSETEATIGTAITGSNATLVKTGSGTVNLASGTTVSTINLTAGTLGNVALSDGMTLATTQGTTISSVTMTGGTLTAAKGTTISSITMEGGTLDASNVFEVTTDSITLSGTNSFSGGTVLLGEGTLLEDGVQSTPIVAAFVIESDSTVSVSGSVVFYIDNVELPDTVYDENGNRVYTISYQVFDTTDGTLKGWTDLIYSNFAIDGVVLSGSERTRVEISSDGSVQFYITEYDLVWNGGESGVWNTSDASWTHNVDDQEYSETYNNGDNVTFTSDYGKLTITLGGDVNPSTLTVDKDADVTINGGEYKITGSKTTIVIEENGKLTLTSGGNDFGGGVTINDGGELALKVSSNEAYLDGVTIALAENASGTFTIDTDANVTYETILSNTSLPDSDGLTLVKDGSGTLTITSELGYESLDLEVKSGTLKIATEGSVGSVDINLSGSANLELENTNTEAKTITNSISGVGTATTIVKTGAGEITVSGDNSGFEGTVEIEAGTLTLSSADALGNVTKTTIAEDGTLKLDIESDFDLDDIVGTVSGSGTIEIDLGDEGTLHATSGYYGSDKFADFTGSFVVHGADGGGTYTMEIDVSSTSQGSAIGDSNIEIDENVNLVFNIQNAGYSYSGEISGSGTVSFKWDSTSSVSHTFSLTGDNSGFSGTIEIPEDIVLTAKGGAALGGEDATVENSGELWIDEDDKSSVVSKLTGSGSLHKTGSGAVKITNTENTLSGSLEIREGSLCFAGSDTLGGISTASVSEGATFELEVDNDSDNEFNVTVSGEGSVVIHGYEGNCIITTYALEHFDGDGYSTDKITLASNDYSSYNGGLTIDSAYLITLKTSSYDSMNELGTSTVTITNDSTWDASNGGFTASGSRTITIENHSRLLAGSFSAVANSGGHISISNIRIDTNADDAADLYISVTSSSDITRNYITGSGGTIYLDDVDIYLDTTITSFGQITVIDTSEGLQIVGTPSVYINGELESESYWINGVISQDSISEDVKKHGLSYAAMVVMPTEAFIQDVRTIHSRLEQRRFAFSREGEWEFFAQAQTIQEDSGSGSDSKSFDYQTYGAIVGADVRIDQTTIFGMALAYDHGDAKLHHSEGHIKMDDYRFTAFGSKVFANWLFVEGGAQFGIGSYDIRRRAGSTVGDNNGDTDGVNVGGFFTFGGVVPITDNIFLTPYIGLTYMYSHVDSFDETGSYGYKADDFNANSLRGKIGTQLRTELMLGDVPTAFALGLSYAHEFIDDDIDYDVAAITYSDKKQSLTENAFTEDLISIGLSAEFGVTDSASVFMGYNADIGLGNSEVSHAVNAGLKVTF